MTVSNDVQREIVSALLKNSYLLSICKDEINEGYFSDGACKVIYKALSTYYSKYNALPSFNEMIIGIDDCYVPMLGVNLADIKDICCKLFESPEADEAFIKDKITDFLRKVRSAEALKVFVEKLKNNPNLESDTVVAELVKALDVQLSTSKIFIMNDLDAVKEARLSAVGSDDQSTVIPSYISSFNQALAFGGYQPGTVSMVVAPPGCFTGDTELMFADGSVKKLNTLTKCKEPLEIIGSDEESYILKEGTAHSVVQTDVVNELYDIEIDKKYHVRCTIDHPFMLMDGTYKEAQKLEIGDKLRGVANSKMPLTAHPYYHHVYNINMYTVTNVTYTSFPKLEPVYGVVEAKPFGNYAIALDKEHGLLVHNTGKSMHLINEGVNASKLGFDVLHIFIGDLVEYDGFIRYLSCISSVDQNQLIRLSPEKQIELVKYYDQQYDHIFGRISILAYPSLSLTVDMLIEEINKFEKHLGKDFGMIIIDYPDNLLQEGKSLYEDGGTLYSSLERLARLTKSVVLVASQPGKAYWNHSIIPLEAAAESSKKQQAVDNMLTLNTEYRGANFGSMLLAKARKGDVGKIFRFKTDFTRCKLEEIDEGTYNVFKSNSQNNYNNNKS